MARLTQKQSELIEEKQALEKMLSSEDGKLFLDYLGKLCLSDMGVQKKDALGYAYSEGRRSVFLTLMQFANRSTTLMLNDMVKEQELRREQELLND